MRHCERIRHPGPTGGFIFSPRSPDALRYRRGKTAASTRPHFRDGTLISQVALKPQHSVCLTCISRLPELVEQVPVIGLHGLLRGSRHLSQKRAGTLPSLASALPMHSVGVLASALGSRGNSRRFSNRNRPPLVEWRVQEDASPPFQRFCWPEVLRGLRQLSWPAAAPPAPARCALPSTLASSSRRSLP